MTIRTGAIRGAALLLAGASLFVSQGKADDPYWRNHWQWFDGTYTPYHARRYSYGSPYSGAPNSYGTKVAGSLREEGAPRLFTPGGFRPRPDDPILRQNPYSTPIGGGSYHAPKPNDPIVRQYKGTPIGGGAFEAPPSHYSGILTPGPAENGDDRGVYRYGWW